MECNDSSSTQLLLRAVQSGGQGSLEQLLQRHRPYLRRLVDVRLEPALRQRVDASDIVQDALRVASARLDEFVRERPMSFRVWLRRSAMDRLIEARRRHYAKRRDVRRDLPVTDVSSLIIARSLFHEAATNSLQRKELFLQVRDALAELSEPDREMIIMRHAECLTNQEAAEALGIDRSVASKRYGRALSRLAKELRKRGIRSL